MTLKKRIPTTIIAVLLIGLVHIGCSGVGSDELADENKMADESFSDINYQSGITEEGIVLTFYGFSEWVDSLPYKDYYEAAVAQFEQEFPGYTVELQSDPWGDWVMKYVAMFAAGNPTDIFIIGNDMVPEFANSGLLLALDDFVEPGFFDRFFPSVQSMYSWQGSNMAIAFTTDCRILWWNKDIFEEAGLDPEVPPATWAELANFANIITQNTGMPGFGMDLGLREFPVQAVFNASTGSIINVADDGSISPNVDTPEFRGYLQLLLEMRPSFQPDFAVQNHHDVARLFASGQFGMIIGNTLIETDIYNYDFWGQALIPRMNEDSPNGSFGGGFGIAVSARTAAPEKAVRFAQILTSYEFNSRLISDLPASEAGLAVSEFATDPNMAVYLLQIQYARQAQPKTLFYPEIDAAVHDTVIDVLIGGVSIDAAIADLTTRIMSIVS